MLLVLCLLCLSELNLVNDTTRTASDHEALLGRVHGLSKLACVITGQVADDPTARSA